MKANNHNDNYVGAARLVHSQDDWPTLLSKLFQDFTSVLEHEAELIGVRVKPVFERTIADAFQKLILVLMSLFGIGCLIASVVLLVHTRLNWWQSFGATGVGLIVVVTIVSQLGGRRAG